MNKDNFFFRIMDGRLPVPECAKTLGTNFTRINVQGGTIEVDFEGRRNFSIRQAISRAAFLPPCSTDMLGPALVATLDAGGFAPTLNLNVQSHRPGKTGKFIGNGRVVTRGRDICHLAGELRQDGRIVATATATATIRKL